ncbi:flavin-binding monooxygenase-like protein-like protein [Hypoxylon sp. FL1150]|nr:flavin-binding monooxygenase-like protein-like protein [Hypoxylon sp. FL1150]
MMSLVESATNFAIIVVGAGLTGIIGARRLLQAHPETRLAILERDYCVGGVWSERRTYPSFWTQWTHGIAEFSDMPMERPPKEDYTHDLFHAKYTTKHLEDYVCSMTHAGKTLRDRIQFNIQSSVPNVPDLPGKEHFQGKVIHSIDFGQSDIVQDKSVQHVAVIGAGKSAADMVYESVKVGKTASWIIFRTVNGSLGAAAFAPIDLPTPYKNRVEASQVRIMASLQSSYLILCRSLWTWMLRSTSLGARLMGKTFSLPDSSGFENLEYDNDIIWQTGTAGGCHFADFWPLVADKIYVHRSDVTRISLAMSSCAGPAGKTDLTQIHPKHYHKYETRTPYRPYHTMAPIHVDSILFMNHAQAIWAVACWDKAFALPSVAEREDDIAHMIAWNKRRCLSNGELGDFAPFDSVPYADRLFDELGVISHRKKGLLGNIFAPIKSADLPTYLR